MTSHELYCDERHSERQQCNALAPAGIRASVPIESDAVEVAEPAAMVEPEEEPASSAVREAVAAADVPEPTVYVSREWDRTASAVEANGGDDEGFDVEKSASGGGTRATRCDGVGSDRGCIGNGARREGAAQRARIGAARRASVPDGNRSEGPLFERVGFIHDVLIVPHLFWNGRPVRS